MARTVIITGADSGIGKATAVVLAQQGYDVGITWHEDEDGAQATANEVREHGVRAEVSRLDLMEPESGVAVVNDLTQRLGGLDVFVNNAGTGVMKPFLELTFEEWRHPLTVDLDGAFVCGQRAAQIMLEQGRGGRIINVTSVHEHVPLRQSAPYCAAKGGLGLLTKVMALELAEYGITVNSVAPGETATPMTGNEDANVYHIAREAIPMGRPGDARETAHAIAYLASPEAAYTTGASLVVDGGLMLMAAVANQE